MTLAIAALMAIIGFQAPKTGIGVLEGVVTRSDSSRPVEGARVAIWGDQGPISKRGRTPTDTTLLATFLPVFSTWRLPPRDSTICGTDRNGKALRTEVKVGEPGMGSNFYVADIRSGARSVFDDGLIVSKDPIDLLEVVLGTDGGTISGSIAGAKKLPALVVLAPIPTRRQNSALFKTMMLEDASQPFRFAAVAPGSYSLFAFEVLESSETVPYRSSDFLSLHETRSVHVTVEKGVVTAPIRVPLIQRSRLSRGCRPCAKAHTGEYVEGRKLRPAKIVATTGRRSYRSVIRGLLALSTTTTSAGAIVDSNFRHSWS